MIDRKKHNGLLKRIAAVTLGIMMTFGALMVPGISVKYEHVYAREDIVEVEGNKYTISFDYIDGRYTIKIDNIETSEETLEIPSTLQFNSITYEVSELSDNCLKGDNVVKTITLPDKVVRIGNNVLSDSSIENINLPDSLTHIGRGFASNCPELKTVKYSGTNIKPDEMGSNIFKNSEISGIINEKGALCLGNWLLRYEPDMATEVRFADLGNDGIKIEYINSNIFQYHTCLKTVDLEGIKYIGRGCLSYCPDLTTIINDDSIDQVNEYSIDRLPWYLNSKETGLVKLGSTLFYYRTDHPVIDMTTEEFSKIKYIRESAFKDCINVDTLLFNSDQELSSNCLHLEYNIYSSGADPNDDFPKEPFYKVKTIYIDGKKLEYQESSPKMGQVLTDNYFRLEGTAWLRETAETKAKQLFKQLDIPYYGLYNDKVGTLSKTEEFYNFLKIHDYISIYDYDYNGEYKGGINAFLVGGKTNCHGYAELTGFLLECAGVDYMELTCTTGVHSWNEVRIGNEWFESDEGWDEQSSHGYKWFALSSSRINENDSSKDHEVKYTSTTWHYLDSTDRIEAKRVLGDIDENNKRDDTDAELLWAYLKDESNAINKTAADINFDGVIDITDGVLLENFVHGQAIDPENMPTDGLAPGFKTAFVNGTDYDNIKYEYTDRDGYLTLPADIFEAPEGMKLKGYNIGKVGEKVKIHYPYTVISPVWVDISAPEDSSEPESSSTPDSSSSTISVSDSSRPDDSSTTGSDGKLGDVNNDGTIDIEDAVAIIQHINGLTPLTNTQEKRADVSKDDTIDIDDAVILISYINGNSTF